MTADTNFIFRMLKFCEEKIHLPNDSHLFLGEPREAGSASRRDGVRSFVHLFVHSFVWPFFCSFGQIKIEMLISRLP